LFSNTNLAVVIRALDGLDGGSLSLVGMSPEEMRESQQRDPDLSSFCQWLSADEEPEEGELFFTSAALKYLWVNRALFMRDEDLWKLTEWQESESRLLVIPRELREKVVRLCHDVSS
jgi:hypothetical protein